MVIQRVSRRKRKERKGQEIVESRRQGKEGDAINWTE
jgi:hypothetical protein